VACATWARFTLALGGRRHVLKMLNRIILHPFFVALDMEPLGDDAAM